MIKRRILGPGRAYASRKLGTLLSLVGEPLGRRVVDSLSRYDAEAGPLRQLVHEVQVGRAQVDARAAETNLLLDGLVREISRLQRQVDGLRREVAELSASRESGEFAAAGRG